MGVFTTRTLLSSVGVSQSKVTPGAIAINWILKVNNYVYSRGYFFWSPCLCNLLKSSENRGNSCNEGLSQSITTGMNTKQVEINEYMLK
jgi:hypothetical protein